MGTLGNSGVGGKGRHREAPRGREDHCLRICGMTIPSALPRGALLARLLGALWVVAKSFQMCVYHRPLQGDVPLPVSLSLSQKASFLKQNRLHRRWPWSDLGRPWPHTA